MLNFKLLVSGLTVAALTVPAVTWADEDGSETVVNKRIEAGASTKGGQVALRGESRDSDLNGAWAGIALGKAGGRWIGELELGSVNGEHLSDRSLPRKRTHSLWVLGARATEQQFNTAFFGKVGARVYTNRANGSHVSFLVNPFGWHTDRVNKAHGLDANAQVLTRQNFGDLARIEAAVGAGLLYKHTMSRPDNGPDLEQQGVGFSYNASLAAELHFSSHAYLRAEAIAEGQSYKAHYGGYRTDAFDARIETRAVTGMASIVAPL